MSKKAGSQKIPWGPDIVPSPISALGRVGWGTPVDAKPDALKVVDAANRLRDYFIKKRYQANWLVTNLKMDYDRIIVFRGQDQKGRMILMILTDPKKNDKKKFFRDTSLRLSYMLNPNSPDIRAIKGGSFLNPNRLAVY